MNDESWCNAMDFVFGGFHQMVSCPRRAPSHPASAAAARPISADSTSWATVRSDFHALAMWRVTSGRLMPSRQYHSSG